MEGRAALTACVSEEGSLYNAWVQLNFDKQDRKGNCEIETCASEGLFNLYQLLGELSIKEFKTKKSQTTLINRLYEGDRVVVSLQNQHLDKMILELDPVKAKINLLPAE